MSLFDDTNKIKKDWGQEAAVRKECQSCFKEYETNNRWSQRCFPCKKIDAPKRKKLINTTQVLPF